MHKKQWLWRKKAQQVVGRRCIKREAGQTAKRRNQIHARAGFGIHQQQKQPKEKHHVGQEVYCQRRRLSEAGIYQATYPGSKGPERYFKRY